MALNPLDRLVRDMEDVKRQLAGRSQLNHSSLENTAIPVFDEDGTERLRIGAQDDGTHAVVYVQGPPPPRPTAPIVSVDGPVVRVRWDGQLMGGHIPEDFARIDVHFALAADDLVDPSAVRANLATAAGSEVTLMATATGAYRVGLVAVSQSRARSEMSDTVEVEVQVVDLAEAIETATQSANGKNTVTYSATPPTPADEGVEGDTWWVNETRPRDEGDPASGMVVAIIEQWQHVAGEWRQVELAHEVIASVDLGRATVGYLHGERVEAGTIDTPQLAFGAATGDIVSADALNFKTARGMEIIGSTFRAGDSVEITEEYGIRQFGPDGALNISLPSDGSPAAFRGDLSARTLTATGQMSIQGPGAVASGGVLELESGVVPPVSPPTVRAYLEATALPELAANERGRGITFADGHWWRFIDVESQAVLARFEKITPAGELVDTFPFANQFWPWNGATSIGDELFVLGTKVGPGWSKRFVQVYGLDGAFKREWEYPNYGTGTYQPGIGTNGTDVLIAQCWANGLLTWRRFNKTTGAMIQQVDTSDQFNNDVTGVYAGNGDFGSPRVLVSSPTGYVSALNNTTWVPTESWRSPHGEMYGLSYFDGRFYQAARSGGSVFAYSTHTVGTDGDLNDWWITFTWASSTAETPAAPPRRFTFLRRADLRVTYDTPPATATRVRVYLARKATEPSRTDFHLIAEAPADTEQGTIVLPADWETQANPPAVNTFEDSTPGILRSTAGLFEVDGTGAGHWGPLTFHADGTMTSNAVPAWTPITTFKPGFAPATFGFVPAYRVWPDGKVEWRGVIAGTVSKSMGIVTIPVGARPPHAVNVPAATGIAGSADGLVRVEFGAVDRPTEISVYPEEKAITWVSLDGLYYYLA